MLVSNPNLKITDFGIARAVATISVRKTLMVWGSPYYFFPEQASGKPLQRPTYIHLDCMN
jgi:serine/threonine-protein kinase